MNKTNLSTDLIHELGETYRVPALAELVLWSLNYDYGKRPLEAFFDLTGVYAEDFGNVRMSEAEPGEWGYVELDLVGRALTEYSHRPQQAKDYLDKLDELEAEAESDNQHLPDLNPVRVIEPGLVLPGGSVPGMSEARRL